MDVNTRIKGKHNFPMCMAKVPVILTKEFDFEAGHHLEPYEGRCEFSHGHSYHMEVSVIGIPDPKTGLLVDFKIIKDVVNEIIDELDHNYLNDYFNFNTTCEHMIRYLWCAIENKLPTQVDLEEIKLWETRKSHATLNRRMVMEYSNLEECHGDCNLEEC